MAIPALSDIVRSSGGIGAFLAGGAVTIYTAELNLGSAPRLSGKATLTDALISGTSKLLIGLAGGPYTGKGTRGDEAEHTGAITFGAVPAVGSATVYWSAANFLSGKVKIFYVIG